MISVAIVDEQRDVREGLQNLLNSAEGYVCIATYSDGESILDDVLRVHPDVILMDIDLPSLSGIECIKSLRLLLPNIEIIVLSNQMEDELIFQTLRAGISGYLSKNIFPSKLLAAITEVVNGGAPMDKTVARMVISSFNKQANIMTQVSKREAEVLTLLCEGQNYKAIAETLFISTNTVRYHLKNIYRKLQVNSRHEAVLKVTGGEN